MKNKFSRQMALAAIGTAVLAFTACKKSPYPGYDLAENGVYVKFYTQAENGIKPKEGDVVKLNLVYKNSKDSIIFDSKKNPSGTPYIEFQLTPSAFKGSFEDALSLMSVGDSASFKISADSLYLKTMHLQKMPPFAEPGSMLTFETKLEKITTKETLEEERRKRMEEKKALAEARKTEEPVEFAKYIENNKIKVKPTASGLYFIEKQKGHGPKPSKGDVVKVKYTGRMLDGTVFDTSEETVAKEEGLYDERRPYEPIEIPIGVGQVIPGWDEGISMMNAGSKAQLIIPSSIAYGEQGGGPIPPYSTLVFDVELISFKPAK